MIMNAVDKLINHMIDNKIYKKVIQVGPGAKVDLFLHDCESHVKAGQIRVKVDFSHIIIRLGSKSLELIAQQKI